MAMMPVLRQIATQTGLSEEQLRIWTRRAYRDEDKRAERSEKLIRHAVAAHPLLRQLPLDVYAKGSYKNNTNVRRDSDVDVAVEYRGIVFLAMAPGQDEGAAMRTRGLMPYRGPLLDRFGRFDAPRFKAAVGEALASAFGPGAVSRSNKVFTVAASERSLPADVVPCGSCNYHLAPDHWVSGAIWLLPDRPTHGSLVNLPRQHHFAGVARNVATARQFKRVTRILKNLENLMVTQGACAPVPSYLIECLVYNVPDACFAYLSRAEQVRSVLAHIAVETRKPACEWTWMEVNGVKPLFGPEQRWTRHQVAAFAAVAWPYVEAI
jgi:hypothetical protein